MPNPIQLIETPPPATRGGSLTPPRKVYASSFAIAWTWGSSPSQATITYHDAVPVAIGSHLQINCLGYTFWGRCQDAREQTSTKGGNVVEIDYVDFREYMNWDDVHCAFNIPTQEIVNGTLVRRYMHLLPANFNSWTWTRTNSPYTAAEVMDFLFSAPTVYDSWTRIYHTDLLNCVIYNIDCIQGRKLAEVVDEISTELGLLYTIMDGPFRLVWARKGEGLLPTPPPSSDDRHVGFTTTQNPTGIRAIGDRNTYQVHNIVLEKDWVTAWEQFYDLSLFQNHIYEIGSSDTAITVDTHTFPAGTPYREIGAASQDPEQTIARQMAAAKALTISVRDYASMVGNNAFLDFRKYAGQSRVDMPAALYITQILLRAFRLPASFTIRNAAGLNVPLQSLTVAREMAAQVTHDPGTGVMTFNASQNPDGIGYAIAKGYQVGKDLFRTIQPERFKLEEWNRIQDVWERIDFELDDSGEPGAQFVLFNEPVINSSDLVELVNGYAVFKANPTITVPEVRIALNFEAEKFNYFTGNTYRVNTLNISNLFGQHVANNSVANPIEIPFLDSSYASEKADEQASALLQRQLVEVRGKFVDFYEPGDSIYQLSGTIDRIQLKVGSEFSIDVNYTSERPSKVYVPERQMERANAVRKLFPGQDQLKVTANYLLLLSAAMRKDPVSRRTLSQAFRGMFGSGPEPVPTFIKPPTAGAVALPVGSPIVKKPTTIANNVATNTQGVIAIEGTAEHEEFCGVTTRNNEPIGVYGARIDLANSGSILARVKGPFDYGDLVGITPGENNLSKSYIGAPVGRVLQKAEVEGVVLAKVLTSSAASTSSVSYPFQIISVSDTQVKVTGNSQVMNGFSVEDRLKIRGVDKAFTPKVNSVIYLEILYDVNGAPFEANICCSPSPVNGDKPATVDQGWYPEVYPRMVKTVRKTENEAELEALPDEWSKHVDFSQADLDLAIEKLTAFGLASATVKQWAAYVVIGFCTQGSSDTQGPTGIRMVDGEDDFTLVQALTTHLMLTDFCDTGTPIVMPLPYSSPLLGALPDVDFVGGVGPVAMSVLDHPDAKIYYTIDGTTPTSESTLYAGPVVMDGVTTLKAVAMKHSYYNSRVHVRVITGPDEFEDEFE